LRSAYEPDFLCFEKIIVELKAAKELSDDHKAQVYNFLKATGITLGLLLNFGHYPKLEVVRVVAESRRYRPY
jgi:GxxExxY protein